MTCVLCHDIGWLLDSNGAGMTEPKSLELIPCIHPECSASGAKLALITFPEGLFRRASLRPTGSSHQVSFVMSVSA